jgi:hypothetical protein
MKEIFKFKTVKNKVNFKKITEITCTVPRPVGEVADHFGTLGVNAWI